jgi:hypothetical protein
MHHLLLQLTLGLRALVQGRTFAHLTEDTTHANSAPAARSEPALRQPGRSPRSAWLQPGCPLGLCAVEERLLAEVRGTRRGALRPGGRPPRDRALGRGQGRCDHP